MNTVRKYAASVREVFSHIGMDKELIKALADLSDGLKKWENPDDEDWQTPLLKVKLPVPFFLKGEIRVNIIDYLHFEGNLVLSVFSTEMRSKNTLEELAEMYKRLKEPPVIPEMALNPRSMNGALNIVIRKMLWISSGRGNAIAKVA